EVKKGAQPGDPKLDNPSLGPPRSTPRRRRMEDSWKPQHVSSTTRSASLVERSLTATTIV
ncbi:unnamed protein product, partial [Ilex paraguariensis]